MGIGFCLLKHKRDEMDNLTALIIICVISIVVGIMVEVEDK